MLGRVLAQQQLSNAASTVRPACRPVVMLSARLAHPISASDSSIADEALARLAENAYGYRLADGRLGRRAASAGAMYPVEVFWLVETGVGWQLCYYDFPTRRCLTVDAESGQVAGLLNLEPGQCAVFLVVVAWRTLQRYGARGYRYCVLDAGNVLGNIAVLARAAGVRCQLSGTANEAQLAHRMRLQRGELLVATAVLDVGFERFAEELPPPIEASSLDLYRPLLDAVAEEPPALARLMTWVERVHQSSRSSSAPPEDLSSLSEHRSVEQAVGDIRARTSARGFAGDSLSEDELHGFARVVVDSLTHLDVGVANVLDARLIVPSAGTLRCERLFGAGPHPLVQSTGVVDAPTLARLFGNQPLASTASAFVVIGLRHSEDDPYELTELSLYRQALLLCGLICSRLYRRAASAGLATTTFGGFDDDEVARVAGGWLMPLVVQALGKPGGCVTKNDVAGTRIALGLPVSAPGWRMK